MKAASRRRIAAFLLLFSTVTLGFANGFTAAAATTDTKPPQIIYRHISSPVVAYHGSQTPGYATITIRTDEPSILSLTVPPHGVIFNWPPNSKDVFTTEHIIYWEPVNGRQPLIPGQYDIGASLMDRSGNTLISGTGLKVKVVAEKNPLPLITNTKIIPSVISPKYGSNEPLTKLSFSLNRYSSVQFGYRLKIPYNNSITYVGSKQNMVPGQHQMAWNGRDSKGQILPDGEYELFLQTLDSIQYHSANEDRIEYIERPNETLIGTVTIKEGEYYMPEWRVRQIVSGAAWQETTIDLNNGGIRDSINGSLILNEDMQRVCLYITNILGVNVTSVITDKNLIKGSHPFAWDGTDYMGGLVPDGTYYLRVFGLESSGAMGQLDIKSQPVKVVNGNQITVPALAQHVRVMTPSTQMRVQPFWQGYKAKEGDTFPILDFVVENSVAYYQVLAAENILGRVPVADVILLDLKSIPPQWRITTQADVPLRRGPGLNYEVLQSLPPGTYLRILRQEGSWYRVLTLSGKQAYVQTTDLSDLPPGNLTFFKDIDKSSDWARASIIHLAENSIVSGDTRGYFKPQDTVTRAQMVTMLVNALGFDTYSASNNLNFRDVPQDNWAHPFVETAYQAGIISGVAPGYFAPDAKCTREMMAVMFVRALGLTDEQIKTQTTEVKFNDDNQISNWARDAVAYCVNNGLMNGVGDGNFNPQGSATREQMAVVTNQFLARQ